jgi:hypothetical protein
MSNVFAYWSSDDDRLIKPFITTWSSAFPGFRLYRDDDVIPLLNSHFPGFERYYRDINIPAAKSDIARLIILFDRGGLYIDCHVGIQSTVSVQQMISRIQSYEMVLVDNAANRHKRPEGTIMVINSVLYAQARNKFISLVLAISLRNIRHAWLQERENHHRECGIWRLTGAGLYNAVLFDGIDLASYPRDEEWQFTNAHIRRRFRRGIEFIAEEQLPLRRKVFKTYRSESEHWSKRQVTEKLFHVCAITASPS